MATMARTRRRKIGACQTAMQAAGGGIRRLVRLSQVSFAQYPKQVGVPNRSR